MLQKEPKKRISINDILKHEWLIMNTLNDQTNQPKSNAKTENTQNFDVKVLQNLQKFHGQSLLKKMALKIFVEHVDPKQIILLKK